RKNRAIIRPSKRNTNVNGFPPVAGCASGSPSSASLTKDVLYSALILGTVSEESPCVPLPSVSTPYCASLSRATLPLLIRCLIGPVAPGPAYLPANTRRRDDPALP